MAIDDCNAHDCNAPRLRQRLNPQLGSRNGGCGFEKRQGVTALAAQRPQAAGGTGLNSTDSSINSAKGDVLVVWKLDRLSRSLRDVLTIMERLGSAIPIRSFAA